MSTTNAVTEKKEAKMKSCLQPAPKVLVSCRNNQGKDNAGLFDYLGHTSKRDEDKLTVIGAALSEAVTINAPLLSDCPVNIECEIVDSIRTGSHEMFVGKILHVHAEESIVAPDGSIDFAAANLL